MKARKVKNNYYIALRRYIEKLELKLVTLTLIFQFCRLDTMVQLPQRVDDA